MPSAISLILADRMPWQPVFWITAAFMLPGLICTLLVDEPQVYGAPLSNMRDAIVLPFKEFISRNGWNRAAWILGFVFPVSNWAKQMAVALSDQILYVD